MRDNINLFNYLIWNNIKLRLITLILMLISYTSTAEILPTGGNITSGSGSISQVSGNMTVNQETSKMVADWQTFNIGTGNSVNFIQPSASSVAFNNVLGSDVSVIQGNLTANGQLFLINPNGVLFTPTAKINVGGVVASTLNLSSDDFLKDNFNFAGGSINSIINEGTINASNAGSISLIAAKITNSGKLTANEGNILLGAGSEVILDLGDSFKIQVTKATIDTLIKNDGAIKADGGLIYLTAQGANNLTNSVINNTGKIEAHTLATGETGKIMLMGGMDGNKIIANNSIVIDGTLDASAPNGGNGGFIETSAANVKIGNNVKVTTAAPLGKTGTWLIDPTDFIIGVGSDANTLSGIGATTLSNSLTNNSVTISTSAIDTGTELGDININGALSWNSNTLTLDAHNNININAVLTASGTSILTMNTGSDKGVNVGMDSAGFTGRVDFAEADGATARSGTGILSINDDTYNIINSVDQLSAMAITGNFALGVNLGDAGSTINFTPIASFANNFNGLGHTITGMNINGAAAANTGMIKIAGATSDIRNVGLVGGVVSNGGAGTGGLIGSGSTGTLSNSYNTGSVAGAAGTGGLIGSTTGIVRNTFATGNVTGTAGTGGLIGNTTGAVSESYATGNITGAAGTGGLIGTTTGAVTNTFATGNITGAAGTGGLIGTTTGAVTNAYATGTISGAAGTGGLIGTTTGAVTKTLAAGNVTGAAGTGGLIGTSTGNISHAHAIGTVSGAAGTGGLIGTSTGNISHAYATGTVSGAAGTGGLMGSSTGVLKNNFWDTANANNSVGSTTPTGTTGLTTSAIDEIDIFHDWDFSNTWFKLTDGAYPLLRSFMTPAIPEVTTPTTALTTLTVKVVKYLKNTSFFIQPKVQSAPSINSGPSSTSVSNESSDQKSDSDSSTDDVEDKEKTIL